VSIPVQIDDLARTMADYESGYLLTNRDGRTRVVTVEPAVVGDHVVIEGPGNGSRANLAENPHCTLVFPPAERHGYTLLVDGTATVTGETLAMQPATAVLHRPARHADDAAPGTSADCENDCRPVG
jgi:hypothetical protein